MSVSEPIMKSSMDDRKKEKRLSKVFLEKKKLAKAVKAKHQSEEKAETEKNSSNHKSKDPEKHPKPKQEAEKVSKPHHKLSTEAVPKIKVKTSSEKDMEKQSRKGSTPVAHFSKDELLLQVHKIQQRRQSLPGGGSSPAEPLAKVKREDSGMRNSS